MKTAYIQFKAPQSKPGRKKDFFLKNVIKKLLVGVLSKIIPKANPDFDSKINDVERWLVECDSENGIPLREIGLNSQCQVIVKMPYEKNYGYWIDNNLTLEEFKKHFIVSEISKENFEQHWRLLE